MIDSTESFEIHIPGQEGRDMDLLHFETRTIGAIVSYVGTGFSGFAYQEGLSTVAGELLRVIDICVGAKPRLSVAGRTDAGVHARGQVISFKLEVDDRFSVARFVRSMNSLLDPRVSVRAAWIASDGFDARFSASYRKYRYRIVYGSTPDPFVSPTVWLLRDRLDTEKVKEAALYLLGEHDFSSFCRKDPNGGSLMRRIDEIFIESVPDGLDIWITASSFCHQMVRSIVGLFYQVGTGKFEPEYVGIALSARDRSKAKILAPAAGLNLWEVGYDGEVIPEWS